MARTKVLLVEDNPRICAQLRSLLESMQLEVYTATTGIEGLLTYNRELPQLVILEQFLPFLSGEEMIHRLRTQVSPAQLPVIVITSSRFGSLTPTARSQVNAICQKPLRAQQFREAVTLALKQTQATSHSRPLPGLHEPEQFYLAWGELSQTPFSTLLFQLKQQQYTGVLTLTLPQGDRRFSFRQGELVYAESVIAGEKFTQFLCKRLPNRLEEATLEQTVAGTGGRAALQREAILRAGILHEQELNPLYQLYLENVVIRSLFLMQGPYQFLDDSAYVNRTAWTPINVLLLLFEGVRRYYMPQKLLQALSPFHLYRCHISPLYEQQISALLPRFQNVSFAPHRLSGKTVQQLLREFTPNTALSAQLLQTLSLARLLVFHGPDGTMGQPRISDSADGPVVFEGALPPLGGQFDPPVTTPHPVIKQTGSHPHTGFAPPSGLSSGTMPTMARAAMGTHHSAEVVPALSALEQRGVTSAATSHKASSAYPLAVPPGQSPFARVSDEESGFRSAHSLSSNPLIEQSREAHLGALAGEEPGHTPRAATVSTVPALQVTTVDPDGLLTAVLPPVHAPSPALAGPPSSSPITPPAWQSAEPYQDDSPSQTSLQAVVGSLVPVNPFIPLAAQEQTMIDRSAFSTPVADSFQPLIASNFMTEPQLSQAEPAVGAFQPLISTQNPLLANQHAGEAEPATVRFQPLVTGDPTAILKQEAEEKEASKSLPWPAQLDVDFLRVQSDNYFLVLDISEGATNEEIQMAYRTLSQQYSPGRIQREAINNPDMRTKAGEVLRRVSQAYSILTDPQARHRFELQLTERKRQIRNRLLYSLEQYREGELCLEQEKFREAEGFFKLALEANPKEPVYFLRLGWSIYQQRSPDPLKRLLARSYIERAVKMNPIFEDAYLYLGMIRKEEGALAEAASLFQRILLLNPGHVEAYQLLGEVSSQT